MTKAKSTDRMLFTQFHNILRSRSSIASERTARWAKQQRFDLVRLSMSTENLARLTEALYCHLYSCLRRVFVPIPPETISGMRKNYTEQLPKTLRFKTANLESPRSKAHKAAHFLGITDLLHSEALRLFSENTTGKRLVPNPGCQIICYDPGDFSGPHNDHHPEQRHLRDGYVDVHLMLSEPTVASQLLVYEKRSGLLNTVEELGHGLAIAIYHLPFWHFTTPLIAKRKALHARRWLLLASYEIEHRKDRTQLN